MRFRRAIGKEKELVPLYLTWKWLKQWMKKKIKSDKGWKGGNECW